MVQITRPNVGQQPLRQRGIGPAPIQGQVAEAQAEQNFGKSVASVSQQYLAGAVKSIQDSAYNKAITDAQRQFARESSVRMQQQTDENGNPTFGTLVNDVGSIGDNIKQNIAANLTDPEVAARFNNDFTKVISNKQIMAFDTARNQHVSFARATISDTIQSTTQTALEDSPELSLQYVNQISEVIAQGVQGGVLSPEEAQRLERSSTENLRLGVLSRQISGNASQMLGFLEGKEPSELGVSEKGKTALMRQAEAGVRDEKRAMDAQVKEQEKQFKESQNLNSGELELGLIKGTVGESEIEAAFAGDQISAEHRIKLLKQAARLEEKAITKRQKQIDIEDSIKNGSALFGMTSGEVNDHFISKVDSLSQEGPITLQQKANIVKDYSVPVNSFAKELGNAITAGSLETAGETIAAFDFLTSERSLTLSKLSAEEKSIVARASEISLNTDVGDREALRRAREEIMNRTPEQVTELNKEFDAIAEFNPENIQDTIKEMFDIDAFTFIVDIPFTESELNRDVVPAMRNLYRNAYAMTGSVDAAIKRVRAETAALFGNSEVGRDEVFMLLPPEQVYKGVPAETLKKDLQQQLKDFRVSEVVEGVPVERTGINALLPDFLADVTVEPEDIFLESDTITRDNVQNPSWGLYFIREDGQKVYLQDPSTGEPVRWSFDIRDFQEKEVVRAAKEVREIREQSLRTQEILAPARRRL